MTQTASRTRREALAFAAGGAAGLAGATPCRARASATAEGIGQWSAWVDPFIGTDGTGHVFPGACVPFGMVAPSPDCADRGWSFSSGYQWRAPRFLGFSNTHISGAGIPELGDVLLMPRAGTGWSEATTDFSAAPDKPSEHAAPGHYGVRLPSHGVAVDLTATRRVALHRWRFEGSGAVQALCDLQHGLLFGNGPRVLRARFEVAEGRGEITGTVWSKNWVERQTSFIVRFDRPIARWRAMPARPDDVAPRLLLDFAGADSREMVVRVALSSVDEEGARRNLDADPLAGDGFEAVRAAAGAAWESLLSRLTIDAPARQTRIFATALYHALIHPSDIADSDGRVRGPDGSVMAAPGGHYPSTLSLWDTFRAANPLQSLVVPERMGAMAAGLIAHHQAQGCLPLWTAWGRETWTMIGNPALPVLAEAIAKDTPGFDRDAALRAMIETSTRDRPYAPAWAQRSWSDYERLGYVPFDRAPGEAVSKTLEYGIGDDAVARVAEALGQPAIARRFAARARTWRRLIDPETGLARGRDSQGRWRTPFDPLAPTSPMNNPGDYTEANAWQYTATPALHDPEGFAAAMGGPGGLGRWLDRFFAIEGAGVNKHLGQEAMIGQYAHGNEPSHHIAWLYAWSDRPRAGWARVREIAERFYGDGPDGIIGNEDCGQMSAWLVFATLGVYPVTPSRGSYVLGAPLVREAELRLPGGKMLALRNRGRRRGHWRLDGQPLAGPMVSHKDLVAGRALVHG